MSSYIEVLLQNVMSPFGDVRLQDAVQSAAAYVLGKQRLPSMAVWIAVAISLLVVVTH